MIERRRHMAMHMVVPKTRLGEKVRARRLELKLSQREVANRIGKTKAYVSAIETGVLRGSSYDTEALTELASALRLAQNDLLELRPPWQLHEPKARPGTAGAQIYDLRRKLDLSARRTAEITGVSVSAVYYIEQKGTGRSADAILRKLTQLATKRCSPVS